MRFPVHAGFVAICLPALKAEELAEDDWLRSDGFASLLLLPATVTLLLLALEAALSQGAVSLGGDSLVGASMQPGPSQAKDVSVSWWWNHVVACTPYETAAAACRSGQDGGAASSSGDSKQQPQHKVVVPGSASVPPAAWQQSAAPGGPDGGSAWVTLLR